MKINRYNELFLLAGTKTKNMFTKTEVFLLKSKILISVKKAKNSLVGKTK